MNQKSATSIVPYTPKRAGNFDSLPHGCGVLYFDVSGPSLGIVTSIIRAKPMNHQPSPAGGTVVKGR